MIQDQLQQVVNRNQYTSWLCKQLEETDTLLIKYQQKIDVLQKHVMRFFVFKNVMIRVHFNSIVYVMAPGQRFILGRRELHCLGEQHPKATYEIG